MSTNKAQREELKKQARIEKLQAEEKLDDLAKSYAMAHDMGYHEAYVKVCKLYKDLVAKASPHKPGEGR